MGGLNLAITDPAVTRPGSFFISREFGCDAGVFPRRGYIFLGASAEFVRATGESNAVLAGLFAVCGLAGRPGAGDGLVRRLRAVAGGGNVRAGRRCPSERERGRCRTDCCAGEMDLAWCRGARVVKQTVL